mgnify:CR=1 FL=1
MRRILVVDDEENLRLVLRTLLRRNGYEVETASSGEEALGLVDSFGPDVILTDVRMPKMGGLDLLATLKAKGNAATVIVMSAYGNTDLAIDAISLTIAKLERTTLDVQIVPFTWAHTNLRNSRAGDRVNLECDMVGKYVLRAVELMGQKV